MKYAIRTEENNEQEMRTGRARPRRKGESLLERQKYGIIVMQGNCKTRSRGTRDPAESRKTVGPSVPLDRNCEVLQLLPLSILS